MDLVAILKRKIEGLQEGDHILGLKAVLRHIETAYKHYTRGQDTGDDTAFTDTIYRSNQSFEGSIKEAYRVLAGKDPSKVRPFDIENYLEKNDVFRPRVLKQFTNYRTEWRNPSTHDYRLDFDEREALLAMVSVSAFAILLVDNIDEHIAFQNVQRAQAELLADQGQIGKSQAGDEPLIDKVERLLSDFNKRFPRPSEGHYNESQAIGSIYAYLQNADPALKVSIDYALGDRRMTDFLIESNEEKLLLEVKIRNTPDMEHQAILQLEQYMSFAGIKRGFYFVPGKKNEKMERSVHAFSSNDDAMISGLVPQCPEDDS